MGLMETTAGAGLPIAEIFKVLTDAVTGFTGTISSLFNGVVALFWDGTNITFIGGMSLLGIGIGLFYFGFKFIRNLIKMRG